MNAIKTLSAAALVLTTGLAVAPAQAADVRWSVHIGLPVPVVTLPMPVPVVTVPVYRTVPVQPVVTVPIYRTVPVHSAPAWRDRDRDGIPDWRDRHDNRRSHSKHWQRADDRRDDRRDERRHDRHRRD